MPTEVHIALRPENVDLLEQFCGLICVLLFLNCVLSYAFVVLLADNVSFGVCLDLRTQSTRLTEIRIRQ